MNTHVLQILIRAIAKTGALDETGKKTADLGKEVSGLQQRFASLGKLGTAAIKTGLTLPIKAALVPLKALTFAVGALGAALAAVGLIAFARKLAELPGLLALCVTGTMEESAELEGMRNAIWGIAGEAVPAMLEALRETSSFMTTERDLLKQYNMGYMLLGETLAKRIPEAYQYLSKVALATGDDVSWLMERLTRSVGRLSTRWMAYIGTVVSMEEAQAWAAQTTGKLVDELTREEIQAAMLERVLMRLEARTSSLPAPTETLMQRMKQLGAEWTALRTDLTDHFLPAAKALYTNLIKIVKAFQALIREGGALYGPLQKLSALFTVLFELTGEGIEKLLGLADKGAAGLEDFVDKLLEAGWKAVEWGANIIVNLAIGMIQGASTALVGAMNFISGLLEWWLGPGSAPRIATNLLDWGASAFTEFLKGFTMANFDVLEGVQRPLKQALAILVDLGQLSEVGAGELFLDLSEKMAAALDHFRKTGEVLEGVFGDLASQVGGGYGASLAELWKRQLNLAIAVERLAAAELRLKNAREGEEAAQTKLSKAAREYNKLVRAGADPAILRAKLQGVKADYDSLEAARKETEEAEEAEKQAAEEVKRRKEQVKLQERLLAQLIAMGKAMVDLEKARRKELEEDYELPPIEWPEIHPPKIDEAFDALKDRIRAKFDELWATIKAKWEESGVMESIGRLQEAWERLRTAVAPVFTWLGDRWDDLKKWATDDAWPWILDQWNKWGIWWDENGPKIKSKLTEIWQTFKDWVVDDVWPNLLEKWEALATWWEEEGGLILLVRIAVLQTAWAVLGETVGAVVDVLVDHVWPKLEGAFTDLVETMRLLGGDWKLDWEFVINALTVLFLGLVGTITALVIVIAGIFSGLLTMAAYFVKNLTSSWKKAVEGAKLIFEGLIKYFVGVWEVLAGLFTLNEDRIAWGFKMLWEGVFDTLKGVWRTIIAWLQLTFGSVWALVKGFVDGFVMFFINLYDRLVGHSIVWDTVRGIADAFSWMVGAVVSTLGGLTSKLWNLGDVLMDSLIGAIRNKGVHLIRTLRDLVNDAVDAAKRALGFGSPSKVFMGLGESLVEGFILGIEKLQKMPALAVGQMVDMTVPAMIGISGGYGTGHRGPNIYITNNFGPDSIRSDRDILKMAEQQQRALTLRGVRDVIQ